MKLSLVRQCNLLIGNQENMSQKDITKKLKRIFTPVADDGDKDSDCE